MSDTEVDGLTPRKEKAVFALLNEPSILKAAEKSGVGERTLHRWLEEPGFQAQYRRARREAFSHAISLSQRYAVLAVNTLGKVMTDNTAAHSAKVSAATAVLRFGREGIELDDLASRLEALEQQAKAAEKNGNHQGPRKWA
jgi:hypothetical protein